MWTPEINEGIVVIVTAILNFRGIFLETMLFRKGVHDILKSTWPIDTKF